MKHILYWMDVFLMRRCWRVIWIDKGGCEHDLGWVMRSSAFEWASENGGRVEYSHHPARAKVKEDWV